MKAKSIQGKSPEETQAVIIDYKPEVIVSTRLSPTEGGKGEDKLEISIKDKGPGIPADIKDKIFQPFFTTKPAGQGTGLGLSLSYEIITQGHDGHLELEIEEGMGTRFIVQLPI